MNTDRETIHRLLENTHYIAVYAGQRVFIYMYENGEVVYVDDGTPAQIIDFLESCQWMTNRLEAALAKGSIFI